MARLFFLKVLLCMSGLHGAAQSKDTLYFHNSQILIGELKGVALGKLEFDADNIEVVSIKIDKIKTIKAMAHLYKVVTVGRRTLFTTIDSSAAGFVQLHTGDSSFVLDINHISSLNPLVSKSQALWQGNIGAGYSYTRSSEIGRLNASADASFSSKKFQLLAKGSLIITQTDTSTGFDNSTVGIYGSYLLTRRLQGITFFSYQRNLELGLARRYQEGGGLGMDVISSVHVRAKLISGLVLSQEKNTEGTNTPSQLEVPLIFLFNFFQFRKPDMSINSSISCFAGITDWGRFRQDASLTINWKIIHDLSISLQLYDNFDNKPPTANSAKLDYGLVFSLSYKFSQ